MIIATCPRCGGPSRALNVWTKVKLCVPCRLPKKRQAYTEAHRQAIAEGMRQFRARQLEAQIDANYAAIRARRRVA